MSIGKTLTKSDGPIMDPLQKDRIRDLVGVWNEDRWGED